MHPRIDQPEQRLIDLANTLVRWCAILTVALVINIGLGAYGAIQGSKAVDKITHYSQQTCQVQQKGLPASRALVGAFNAEANLLSAPLTAAQKKQQTEQTPAQAKAFKDLTTNLNTFKTLVGQQPLTVHCIK